MQITTLQTHRRNATTASGPVSYLDVGHGRAAVFIHGLLANGLLWRHVISAVASEQRRCVAVDLPGHGHTPWADEGADVSLAGLARRVIELVQLFEKADDQTFRDRIESYLNVDQFLRHLAVHTITSNLDTPTTPIPNNSAQAFTAVSPTRTPVNDPGPEATANNPTLRITVPAEFSPRSTAGNSHEE